jgi:hypothetical protein
MGYQIGPWNHCHHHFHHHVHQAVQQRAISLLVHHQYLQRCFETLREVALHCWRWFDLIAPSTLHPPILHQTLSKKFSLVGSTTPKVFDLLTAVAQVRRYIYQQLTCSLSIVAK